MSSQIVKDLNIEEEFYFQWHITEKCNLRCKHCYQTDYSSKNELTSDQLKKVSHIIFDALKKWGKSGSISLTGGEPFLREDDLFNIASDLDANETIAYYDILTNGTLINENSLSRLTNCKKLRRIQLSLEGACAETNDFVRGQGNLRKVIEIIRSLKKNDLTVSIMMTLTRNNQSEITDLVDMMEDEGVDAFSMERFIPEGTGTCLTDQLFNADELKKAYSLYYDLINKNNKIQLLMHRTLFSLLNPSDPTIGAMCSIGANALTVMHDGTVYPCRRLPISLGNILKDGLYKIWYTSDILWKIRDYRNLKGKCHDCEYIPVCRGCRAMAYFVTGDYLAEDPQCWK